MHDPVALGVSFSDYSVTFDLADGRSISAPLEWFPRLLGASPQQRANWRLIGRGAGVHWPDVDEDISIPGLMGLPDQPPPTTPCPTGRAGRHRPALRPALPVHGRSG